jgi:hypothetical protein
MAVRKDLPHAKRQDLSQLMQSEEGREQLRTLFRAYFPNQIPPVPSLIIEMILERERAAGSSESAVA